MATRKWLGTAKLAAQVTDYVFGGTWENNDIVVVTFGNKSVSTVTGSTVIATILATVQAALAALSASLYPEFAEVTFSVVSGTTLRMTSNTPGVSFAATVSTTETGGGAADAQTIDGAASSTGTNSTANSGPNDWSVAANWTGSAIPANGDTVIIEKSDVDILYGLDQSAVSLAALLIHASYTGKIGLPEKNEESTAYTEYRPTYLKIESASVKVGQYEGQGSQRIKLDNSSGTAVTLLVYTTSSSADTDIPAMLWKGTNASNIVRAYGGSLGIAALGGESATVATLGVAAAASVTCGTGLSWTTMDQENGTLTLASNGTTITKENGTLIHLDGTVTTLTNNAGSCDLRGAGTITTLNNAGDVTFENDGRAVTVTNCNLYKGATLRDPGGRVTLTNGFVAVRCGIEELSVNFGRNRTYTVA